MTNEKLVKMLAAQVSAGITSHSKVEGVYGPDIGKQVLDKQKTMSTVEFIDRHLDYFESGKITFSALRELVVGQVNCLEMRSKFAENEITKMMERRECPPQ